MTTIKVGQVYASTHKGDIADGARQRRVVEAVDLAFVSLRTVKPGGRAQPVSRVRFHDNGHGQRIPGHRLVGDVSKGAAMTTVKVNDRHPNFRGDDGRLFLVRCYSCEPVRGRENYGPAVASGSCAWCEWAEPAADGEPS